jgi:hypothetical protein
LFGLPVIPLTLPFMPLVGVGELSSFPAPSLMRFRRPYALRGVNCTSTPALLRAVNNN